MNNLYDRPLIGDLIEDGTLPPDIDKLTKDEFLLWIAAAQGDLDRRMKERRELMAAVKAELARRKAAGEVSA